MKILFFIVSVIIFASCSKNDKIQNVSKEYFNKNILERLKDPSSFKLIKLEVIPIKASSVTEQEILASENLDIAYQNLKLPISAEITPALTTSTKKGNDIVYYKVFLNYYANNSYGARLQQTHELWVLPNSLGVYDKTSLTE